MFHICIPHKLINLILKTDDIGFERLLEKINKKIKPRHNIDSKENSFKGS